MHVYIREYKPTERENNFHILRTMETTMQNEVRETIVVHGKRMQKNVL